MGRRVCGGRWDWHHHRGSPQVLDPVTSIGENCESPGGVRPVMVFAFSLAELVRAVCCSVGKGSLDMVLGQRYFAGQMLRSRSRSLMQMAPSRPLRIWVFGSGSMLRRRLKWGSSYSCATDAVSTHETSRSSNGSSYDLGQQCGNLPRRECAYPQNSKHPQYCQSCKNSSLFLIGLKIPIRLPILIFQFPTIDVDNLGDVMLGDSGRDRVKTTALGHGQRCGNCPDVPTAEQSSKFRRKIVAQLLRKAVEEFRGELDVRSVWLFALHRYTAFRAVDGRLGLWFLVRLIRIC